MMSPGNSRLIGSGGTQMLQINSNENVVIDSSSSSQQPQQQDSQQHSNTKPSSSTSSSNTSSFPSKLLSMLNESNTKGWQNIVSWQMNDAAFKVHQPTEFVKVVMPLYFNQTKYKSFQRQLNLYGFARVTRGPNKGCYVHEMFQRSNESKCLSITRKRVTDVDEEYGDDYDLGLCLGAPTWLNHSTMLADVEPDPIAADIKPSENSNNKNNVQDTTTKNSNNMLNAFENFFQSNVVGTTTSSYDDSDLKKSKKASSTTPSGGPPTTTEEQQPPQENALQRMLEGFLGPKPKEEDDSHRENQNHQETGDNDTTTGTGTGTGRKKYQRAAVFPDKLHDMLDYSSRNNMEDVASWQMDGRAFKVHNISKFMSDIMPLFFKQSKYESLQRQLNLYGFTRVPKGPMKGCYHHPLFIKGGRELSSGMARRKQDDYDCHVTPTAGSSCYPTTDVISSSSVTGSKSSAAMKKQQKKSKETPKAAVNLVRPDMIPSHQENRSGSCLSMTTIGDDNSCFSNNNNWDPMMTMTQPMPIAGGGAAATIMDNSSSAQNNGGSNGSNMLFPDSNTSAVVPSFAGSASFNMSSSTRQPASGSSLFEQDYFMSTMGSMNGSNNNNAMNNGNGGFAAQPWAQNNNIAPPFNNATMMNSNNMNGGMNSSNSSSNHSNNSGGNGGFAAQPWGHVARPMFPPPLNSNNNGGRGGGGNLTRGVSDGSQDMGPTGNCNGNNVSCGGNGNGNNMFAAMPWMQQQPTISNNNNNVAEGMFGFVPTVMTDFQNNM